MRDELKLAIAAARRAGALTLEYYGGKYQINYKEWRDPVTGADLAANTCLKELLLGAYPQYGWLSEETADSTQRLEAERLWIVDPIDGTREFVASIPEYAVSVALVEAGEPVVGVIYNPAADQLFAAVKGGGTFLNGKRVFCSEAPSLDRATLIVSRSETKRGEIEPLRPHLKEVKPLGSVAYKLAAVAAGLGGDFNVSVQPKSEWDVCAGDLLVREAGGQMLDLEGQVRRYNQPDPLIQGGLVAGNPNLVRAMLDLLSSLR
jgi:myo-inositol-1(or 4)-monophosphatase